jgi:hypothetical protein
MARLRKTSDETKGKVERRSKIGFEVEQSLKDVVLMHPLDQNAVVKKLLICQDGPT